MGDKKEKRLSIRIDSDIQEQFNEACKIMGTTPSDEIRRYMYKVVKENNTGPLHIRCGYKDTKQSKDSNSKEYAAEEILKTSKKKTK